MKIKLFTNVSIIRIIFDVKTKCIKTKYRGTDKKKGGKIHQNLKASERLLQMKLKALVHTKREEKLYIIDTFPVYKNNTDRKITNSRCGCLCLVLNLFGQYIFVFFNGMLKSIND